MALYDPLIRLLLIFGTAVTLLSTVFYSERLGGGDRARAFGLVLGPLGIALALLFATNYLPGVKRAAPDADAVSVSN